MSKKTTPSSKLTRLIQTGALQSITLFLCMKFSPPFNID